jgi:hypothetical protein
VREVRRDMVREVGAQIPILGRICAVKSKGKGKVRKKETVKRRRFMGRMFWRK